jgi:hypothetical protein
MNDKILIQIHLFSEMDDEGNIVPVQYELTTTQKHCMVQDIRNKQALIEFGGVFHHTDDIIKIITLD